MTEILWVSLGGVTGALARFGSYRLLSPYFTSGFPAVTLLINCVGSFLFGLFLTPIRTHPAFGLFFAVGVLGAFTTFSTFSFETMQLLRDGKTPLFALNIALSVVLGLASFAAGDWLSIRLRLF